MEPLVNSLRGAFFRLFQAGVAVAAMNLLFLLAILATNGLVDHRKIFDRAARAVQEGFLTAEDYPKTLATQPDQWTDCIGIGLNLAGSPDRSAIEMFRDTETVANDEASCPRLVSLLRREGAVSFSPYNRYWHGYQIVSKPALAYGSLRKLRYIAAALAVAAIFAFGLAVFGAMLGPEGSAFGVWFAGGFILLTDGANLSGSFTHALSLLTIFTVPLVVMVALRVANGAYLLPLCAAAGSVLAFFDLLFNPPLGVMALMLAAAATVPARATARQWLGVLGVVGLGWAIGFFGTYAAKFALAIALATEPAAIASDIFGRAMWEAFGAQEGTNRTFFMASILNYLQVIRPVNFLVFSGITLVFLVAARRLPQTVARWPFWIPALVAIVPFPWYEIMSSQNQVHYWFTYRSAAFSVLCAITAVVVLLQRSHRDS